VAKANAEAEGVKTPENPRRLWAKS